VCFNLVFLRLVSFAFDSADSPSPSLATTIGYLYHAPTYVSGPILRFADYQTPHWLPALSLAKYFARLLFAFCAFELFNRVVFCNAIIQSAKWNPALYATLAMSTGYSEVEIMTSVSFAALFSLWFKFLIIWRLARFWALVEGLPAPENMRRCVANNNSVVEFWKDWHASFNTWLVRYLYVPLGGSKHGAAMQITATCACFGFVAAWHDLELRLWAWALAICLLIVPELAARRWAATSRAWRQAPWWARRAAVAVGGGLTIVALQLVNLVGYTLGVDGTARLLDKTRESREGRWFALYWSAWMVLGSAIMHEQRLRAQADSKLPQQQQQL